MGLRVHFTADDLSRVRVARGPDAMWEIVLSASQLARTEGRAVFGPWRAQTRTRLRGLPGPQSRLIRYLAPPVGDFPDFLTPPQTAPDLASGIEATLSTPRRRLRQDLAVLPGPPGWARPLADGDRNTLAELGEALRNYHRAALAPIWTRLQSLIDADRAVRARALLDHGTDGLLRSLRPTLRWSPPVLEADYPVDRDLHLAGRGLLLVPSVFCHRTPVTLIDPELPPVLVYPIAQPPGWGTRSADRVPDGTLSRLLGSTRAAALRVIEDGCTTGELARRIGVTPPTASQHTTALREADLIVSTRHHNRVLHTLTPLGTALLTSNAASKRAAR
ncbi:ArsR/SmtB family transcription factor [Streptomyces fructofermentans]|uniref:Transcriptional regulator n=1 Tax=Streptomyces fructofermentans TaxID=152141 RepID=A0A918U4N1_9ACTN|nr:helix-turn-helix domain-containing protein [Streptomyces fructofermentans]GGX93312.1 transcriptional regulator [Streptomyces fructofermentans]